jgi:hypothetical protein
MDKFKQVQEVIASVEADVAKFYDGGNAAAGTRVRKAMQDLKVLAQEIRAEVIILHNVLGKIKLLFERIGAFYVKRTPLIKKNSGY